MKTCLENFKDLTIYMKTKYFFVFLKEEINLKIFEFFLNFWIFFWNVSEKTRYFNIKYVSYSVII